MARRLAHGSVLVALGCFLLGVTPVLAVGSPAPSEPAASMTPGVSPGPSDDSVTQPGSRHADVALESLLPTVLGGVSLIRESQLGTDLTLGSSAFDAFLAGLGKDIEDFSLASAYSLGGDVKAQVGAWQIKGAEPDLLIPGYIATLQASSQTPLTVVEETIGGRQLTRIGEPGELAQGPLYVFARGDVLLFVQTPDRALAEEALAKLPQ